MAAGEFMRNAAPVPVFAIVMLFGFIGIEMVGKGGATELLRVYVLVAAIAVVIGADRLVLALTLGERAA